MVDRKPKDPLVEGAGHLGDLRPDPKNARRHNPRNVGMIEDAMHEVGAARSIVVDENNVVLAGNATIEAAAAAGIENVRFIDADGETIIAVRRSGLTDDQKRRLALWDNRAAELADWDPEVLKAYADFEPHLLNGMFGPDELDALLSELSTAGGGDPPEEPASTPALSLAERFLVPPFSVLDARQGYWQDRKRAWLALGILSELGRGTTLLGDGAHSVYTGDSEWSGPRGGSRAQPLTYDRREGEIDERDDVSKKILRNEHPRGRAANAMPGGSLMPVVQDGKIVRGDNHLRPVDTRAIKDHAWQAEKLDHPQARVQYTSADGNFVSNPGDDNRDQAYRMHALTEGEEGEVSEASGTSIFDPVLCELVYRWFSPPEGEVLDPFAGGSVRGIVAAKLGRNYSGLDLRPEQVQANQAQANTIVPERLPRWEVGDAKDVDIHLHGEYDLLFSCPPYFNLERYSDDERDLSTMRPENFLVAYRAIIAKAVGMLRPDRFAAFVVGDVRAKDGPYLNFIGETVRAFEDAGAKLYNEAILVTAVGSLPLRVVRQFEVGRKLGKTHQNVLVFVKGDWRAATAACGPVDIPDLDQLSALGSTDPETGERIIRPEDIAGLGGEV